MGFLKLEIMYETIVITVLQRSCAANWNRLQEIDKLVAETWETISDASYHLLSFEAKAIYKVLNK